MNTPRHSARLLLATLMLAGAAAAQATGPARPATLTHCNWGDIGCTNPPPRQVAPRPVPAPAPALMGQPAPMQRACNKELSSPGECWTNCTTEDEITICDILNLDSFLPEAPGARPGALQAARPMPPGRTVMKTYGNGKKAQGRVR